MLYPNTTVSQSPRISTRATRKGVSMLLRVLAFGFIAIALIAGTASASSCDDYTQIYAKTRLNDANHKKVDLFCPHGQQAISCEAAIGARAGYQDISDRAVSLNECFPRKFNRGRDTRWGCRCRANNIFGYFGHRYRFDWNLKGFATCVPQRCVDRYEAHRHDFDARTK